MLFSTKAIDLNAVKVKLLIDSYLKASGYVVSLNHIGPAHLRVPLTAAPTPDPAKSSSRACDLPSLTSWLGSSAGS